MCCLVGKGIGGQKRDSLDKKGAEIAILRPRDGQGSGSTGTTTGEITERPEI